MGLIFITLFGMQKVSAITNTTTITMNVTSGKNQSGGATAALK